MDEAKRNRYLNFLGDRERKKNYTVTKKQPMKLHIKEAKRERKTTIDITKVEKKNIKRAKSKRFQKGRTIIRRFKLII